MTYDESAKRFVSPCETFLSLFAGFGPCRGWMRNGRSAAFRRLPRRASSTPNRASRAPAEGAQKLRKRALKTMKSLARVKLCAGVFPLIPAVKSSRSGPISLFLVNQTFRKPQTPSAGTLTCVSPFHIMNKSRTFCGEVQAGLFGDNAAHAEGRSTFGLQLQKGAGDVEAYRRIICFLFPKGNRCDASK